MIYSNKISSEKLQTSKTDISKSSVVDKHSFAKVLLRPLVPYFNSSSIHNPGCPLNTINKLNL